MQEEDEDDVEEGEREREKHKTRTNMMCNRKIKIMRKREKKRDGCMRRTKTMFKRS